MDTVYKSNIRPNALQGIAEGVRACADVVGKTMGAAGQNVIIEAEFVPYHEITNDGAKAIAAMKFDDPLQKMGHSFLKEVTDRSNGNAGDGSSTTVVLTDAILREGLASGVSPMELKESLDACLPFIEKSIDDQTKQITPDEIEQVAYISSENKDLAKTLGEIYKQIGKDGIIHLKGSAMSKTSYVVKEGIRFKNTGFLSPTMVHDEAAVKLHQLESKAVYEYPMILVTKRKISHQNDINPLLQRMSEMGKKDLVIFTDDMDSGVAALLVKAHTDKVLNCLIIKAPVVFKQYVFEDFAKVTGATIVEDSTGITFKNLSLNHLGTCARIVVDKDETLITPSVDFSAHIASLKKEAETDETNDALRRISWLQTKTAELSLGASSESELSYLMPKAEDAIHSCKHALQQGVVVGGGICLLNASLRLPTDTIGGKILREALKAPTRQIMANAGHEAMGDDVLSGTDENMAYNNHGLNVKTGKFENLLSSGIVDSAVVVKNAIRNALGVVSTILTAPTLITIPPKTTEQIAAELVSKRGLSPF